METFKIILGAFMLFNIFPTLIGALYKFDYGESFFKGYLEGLKIQVFVILIAATIFSAIWLIVGN